MRIFLLRVLIGIWIIPIVWTIGFCVIWLYAGYDEAVDFCLEMSRMFWYGE